MSKITWNQCLFFFPVSSQFHKCIFHYLFFFQVLSLFCPPGIWLPLTQLTVGYWKTRCKCLCWSWLSLNLILFLSSVSRSLQFCTWYSILKVWNLMKKKIANQFFFPQRGKLCSANSVCLIFLLNSNCCLFFYCREPLTWGVGTHQATSYFPSPHLSDTPSVPLSFHMYLMWVFPGLYVLISTFF